MKNVFVVVYIDEQGNPCADSRFYDSEYKALVKACCLNDDGFKARVIELKKAN